VSNIISLDEKLRLSKEKKDILLRTRKIKAVQKTLQCTNCPSKCEKCGTHVSGEDFPAGRKSYKLRVPYRFCTGCSDEYVDYIEWLKGNRSSEVYWYNEEWAAAWRSWIEYQGASDRYCRSKEFRKLLQEIQKNRPDT